jgi:hypothetical protein
MKVLMKSKSVLAAFRLASLLFVLAFGLAGASRVWATVTITGATGGSSLSADTAASASVPAWATLGPITIAEGANADFGAGTNVTVLLKAPSGFVFNTAVTPDITYTASKDITAAAVAVTDSTTLTLTLTVSNTANRDTLIIGNTTGIQVQPSAGTPLATGKHLYRPTSGGTATVTGVTTSADGSSGSNFGTLTEVAGAATSLRLETAANGSGTIVPAQSVTAGSSLTAYAITRDAFGNFIANLAADTWSLTAKTGGIAEADLAPAGSLKNAVFTGHLTGTAVIHAASGSLPTTDSGTLTVASGAANKLAFITAPQTLTAGVNSSTITVQLQDVGGNPTNSTSVRTLNLTKTSTGGLFRDVADTTKIGRAHV